MSYNIGKPTLKSRMNGIATPNTAFVLKDGESGVGPGSRGVKFERYVFLEQDRMGVWAAPSGAKIANLPLMMSWTALHPEPGYTRMEAVRESHKDAGHNTRSGYRKNHLSGTWG